MEILQDDELEFCVIAGLKTRMAYVTGDAKTSITGMVDEWQVIAIDEKPTRVIYHGWDLELAKFTFLKHEKEGKLLGRKF